MGRAGRNRVAATNPFEPLNEAREGTLFLPEISNLSKAEQKGFTQMLAKLEKFNFRLVCAATGPADDGGGWPLRCGLYHPALRAHHPRTGDRDHPEDVPDIAATMLDPALDANESPASRPTVGALNVMRNLDWPGNLPVLQNR